MFMFVLQGVGLSLHCPDKHCDFPLHPSSLPPLHCHCRYNMSSKMVSCASYCNDSLLSLHNSSFCPSLPSLSILHPLPLTFLLLTSSLHFPPSPSLTPSPSPPPPHFPPSLSLTPLLLDVPASGTLQEVLPVSYVIHNHTFLVQEFEVRIGASDTFMYSGQRLVQPEWLA